MNTDLPNPFILNLLNKYIPKENIEVDMIYDNILNEYHILVRIRNLGISSIRITKRTKWINMKRYIDSKRNLTEFHSDCEICYKEHSSSVGESCNKFASCIDCYNRLCVDCYYNIIKSNAGIFRCPYCRFEYGRTNFNLV